MEKVVTGQPLRISAATFNSFVDAAIANKARLGDGTGNVVPQTRKPGTITVRNTTGDTLERMSTAAIAEPTVDPVAEPDEFFANVVIDVRAIEEGDAGRFVVMAESVLKGEVGIAYAFGIVPALVRIDDTEHVSCDCVEGETTLVSLPAGEGAGTILWRAGDSGEQMCIIRIDGVGGSSDTMIVTLASSNEYHRFCDPPEDPETSTAYTSAIYGHHEILERLGTAPLTALVRRAAWSSPIVCESVDEAIVKYVGGGGDMPV